ncbi:hypothetical protein [Alkalibacterium olivapovliticus]|uniref:ABC-2 family transporter n=1 Tax=Alkalibacterium olivapovliticus TaxID=99907 RepID=A0A2T0VVW8_9LACT|nr:hypothetical protein [Alkalibacterium olivapovliticus]PRY75911.1 hypothetical protein CLV38_13316 [Alkalibacterium olivapovliticus]
MIQYFRFELKAFSRNKKNLAVIILLLLASLYYSIILVPDYQPNESVDESDIRSEHDSMVYWIDNMQGDGISSGAQFALAYYPELINIDSQRLQALEEEDYQNYTDWTAEWYTYQDTYTFGYPEFLSYNHVYYGPDQDYPLQEGSYWYRETARRYEEYVNEGIDLTVDVLEERTALQTVYRLLNSTIVPILLITVIVFYANDIVVKDRKHLTITKSFPLSFSGKLWTKTMVVLTTTGVTILVFFLIILLAVGFRHGVGSFSIPITVYDGLVLQNRGTFNSISLGLFYIQAFSLLLLISYLFTRIIILLSLLVRNEFFNLFAGIALIFTERLYYIRGIGSFSDVDLLPSTFFPVGQVLSGYQNHLYNSPAITFENGVLSLMAAILLVEMILFIATRFKRIRTYI